MSTFGELSSSSFALPRHQKKLQLTQYEPSNANYVALCRFVANGNCSYVSSSTRRHVTVAQKLADWTLVTNEASETHLSRRSVRQLPRINFLMETTPQFFVPLIPLHWTRGRMALLQKQPTHLDGIHSKDPVLPSEV